MDKEFKSGLMDHVMKDSGVTIKLMELVNQFMQMVMFTTEIGSMTKLMAMVLILMQMVLTTKVIGLMISSTAMEWRLGLMELSMKESIKMERKMEEAN